MAKFEISIYDMKTEKVIKTLQRNVIPVNLFLKYQTLAEKLLNQKITNDGDMFVELRGLFLETFPDMTADEYMGCTDTAEVLAMFRNIIDKSTQVSPSKNA